MSILSPSIERYLFCRHFASVAPPWAPLLALYQLYERSLKTLQDQRTQHARFLNIFPYGVPRPHMTVTHVLIIQLITGWGMSELGIKRVYDSFSRGIPSDLLVDQCAYSDLPLAMTLPISLLLTSSPNHCASRYPRQWLATNALVAGLVTSRFAESPSLMGLLDLVRQQLNQMGMYYRPSPATDLPRDSLQNQRRRSEFHAECQLEEPSQAIVLDESIQIPSDIGNDSDPVVIGLLKMFKGHTSTRPFRTVEGRHFMAIGVGKPNDGFQVAMAQDEPLLFLQDITLQPGELGQRALKAHLNTTLETKLRRVSSWATGSKITVTESYSQMDEKWSEAVVEAHFKASMAGEVRDKPRSILQEVSNTFFGRSYQPAQFVRAYDWATRFRLTVDGGPPGNLRYCMLSDVNFVTPFHPDFSAVTNIASVIRGQKDFYFLPPSEENLARAIIAKNSSPRLLFPSDGSDILKISVSEGQSILIPGGWLHAVNTVKPTLMVISDFLHDYNIVRQIQVWKMQRLYDNGDNPAQSEFLWLNWRALSSILERIDRRDTPAGHKDPPLPSLGSILVLAEFLAEFAQETVETADFYNTQAYDASHERLLKDTQAAKSFVERSSSSFRE